MSNCALEEKIKNGLKVELRYIMNEDIPDQAKPLPSVWENRMKLRAGTVAILE